MYHIVYKTTHTPTGKFYIGVHSTNNLDDGYLGSGKYLKRAIKLYGRTAFIREILYKCESKEAAFELEHLLITDILIRSDNTYNLSEGGRGNRGKNCNSRTVIVYDQEFNLVTSFSNFVKAATYLQCHPSTVRAACKYAEQHKSSFVKNHYVCFEGQQPVKRDETYLRERNKKLSELNRGKKRPDHSKLMKTINLARPAAQLRFRFTHTSGIVFDGTRTELRETFPTHNLNRSELTALVHGRYITHRGWTAAPI